MSNNNLRIEQQENRPLSPEEFMKDETLGRFDTQNKIKSMNEYAAYRTVYSHNKHLTEYEDEIKQLKEERYRAIQLLQMLIWRSAIKVFPKDQNPPKKQVNDFLNQLKHEQ